MNRKELESYTVTMDATIMQAAEVITTNYARCAIVVGGRKVLGVISEGDILRALIDGAHRHAPIRNFVKHDFKMLKQRSIEEAAGLVREYGITLIPVVDDDLTLIDVMTLQDVMDHFR